MIYTIATALLLSASPQPTKQLPTLFLQEFHFSQFSNHIEQESPSAVEEIPLLSIDHSDDKAHFGDSQAYHEMMVHVPLLAHENPKSILIIGGANGSSIREALKHRSVQTAVIVNANPIQFEEQRVTVVLEDPARYIKKCNETFDIIICDTPQEIFTSEFYEDCKDLLNKRGIFVNYSGTISLNQETLNAISANRAPHFKYNTYYLAATSRGQVAFGWASDKKYRVSESTLEERVSKIKEPMLYYTPEVHRAAFALPNYLYTTRDSKLAVNQR